MRGTFKLWYAMYLVKVELTVEWFHKEQAMGKFINYQSNLLAQLEKGELSTKTGFFTRNEYLNSINENRSNQIKMQKSFLDTEEKFLKNFPLVFTNMTKLKEYLEVDEFFKTFNFGNLDYFFLRRQLANRNGHYTASAEHPEHPGIKMLKLSILKVKANPRPVMVLQQ
jgi:hypothetical protein